MARRISNECAAVLAAFLRANRPVYGLEIIREAGIASGTVYPLLIRLERERILSSRWENVDESAAGRPRRRLYTLRRADAARQRLDEWAEATAKRRMQTLLPRPPIVAE
jgi:PadR family transcriptional regulator PadR